MKTNCALMHLIFSQMTLKYIILSIFRKAVLKIEGIMGPKLHT